MQKLMFNNIIFQESNEALKNILSKYLNTAKIFVLTNDIVYKNCFDKIKRALDTKNLELIIIADGEQYKTINSCNLIWQTLLKHNADRNTILINIGGGVILDLGGFAAATYKRGVSFINIPTTLLAQADVSLGGKTGVNFLNVKNSIGSFCDPIITIIDTSFLNTLDKHELLSGFAEIIKHALIDSKVFFEELLTYSKESLYSLDIELINKLLLKSLEIKHKIIAADPYEQNQRKKLNFGHNIAHALESLYLNKGKSILHGYAVAFGMVAESYLSYRSSCLNLVSLNRISKYIFSIFNNQYEITPDDIDLLYDFMLNDKKNIIRDSHIDISFTLLKDIGVSDINYCINEKSLIKEAIEFSINENILS